MNAYKKFKAVKEEELPFVVALADGGLSQDFRRALDRVLLGEPELVITRRDGAAVGGE